MKPELKTTNIMQNLTIPSQNKTITGINRIVASENSTLNTTEITSTSIQDYEINFNITNSEITTSNLSSTTMSIKNHIQTWNRNITTKYRYTWVLTAKNWTKCDSTCSGIFNYII